MPAASKSELLSVSGKEFDKLARLIEGIDAEFAMVKRDADISIKDVIAHRAHWIDLFLGWYDDGMAGKIVHFPAQGYTWGDLKRYNADLRARQSGLLWPGAVALLRTNYDRLVEFIETRSESQLYGGPMQGARNTWTAGRWAEAAGPSHFRSASKFIRSCIRSASSP